MMYGSIVISKKKVRRWQMHRPQALRVSSGAVNKVQSSSVSLPESFLLSHSFHASLSSPPLSLPLSYACSTADNTFNL